MKPFNNLLLLPFHSHDDVFGQQKWFTFYSSEARHDEQTSLACICRIPHWKVNVMISAYTSKWILRSACGMTWPSNREPQ